MPGRRHAGLLIAAAAMAFAPSSASAQDFYAGKTIDFIVGHYVGGGYDIYARAVARHFSRHIPGNPAIVVRNMPGAGSAKAGMHITHTAAKDGTVIGAVTPGAIMSALLDGRSDATFDPTKALFIGTANYGTRICVTMKDAGTSVVRRPAQAQDRHRFGGGQRRHPRLCLHGEERHRRAAFDRDRLQGHERYRAGDGAARSRRRLRLGLGEPQVAARALAEGRPGAGSCADRPRQDEELTARGVPPLWKFIKTDDDRRVVELITGQQVFHRSYIAPPGVPAAQLATLRTAFMATMKDPQFLVDAQKTGIDVLPLDGGKIQDVINRLAAAPDSVVQRAKRAIRP